MCYFFQIRCIYYCNNVLLWYYVCQCFFSSCLQTDVPKTIVSSARSQMKKTGTNELDLLGFFLPSTPFPLENIPSATLDSRINCCVAWGKKCENTEMNIATKYHAFSTIVKHTGLWWNHYVRSSSNVSYPPYEISYVAYTCLALMAVSWALCKGRKVGYCPIYRRHSTSIPMVGAD